MAIGVEEYSPSSLDPVPHRSNNIYNHQSDVEQNLSSTGQQLEQKYQELKPKAVPCSDKYSKKFITTKIDRLLARLSWLRYN